MRQWGCSKTQIKLVCSFACTPLTKQVQIHDLASPFYTKSPSLGRRQADNRVSKIFLQFWWRWPLTWNMKVSFGRNKDIWSMLWWPFPRIFFLKDTGKMVLKSPPPWTSHRKAECWQDVAASNHTIWSLIILGWDLVGGIRALCELFHLVVALGFFFRLLCSLEWPGKGGGGRTQHSQLAW